MKGKCFGSILIIAGTGIGAGMLAMPISTATIGFIPTLFLLFVLWALMCYSALLLTEVYQHQPIEAGLSTLARNYLGLAGQISVAICMVLLFYSLTAAYITGGGELINRIWQKTSQTGIDNTRWSIFLFTLIGGLFVSVGTQAVDWLNRLLFIIKIIVFILLIGILLPHVKASNLAYYSHQSGFILAAIPIIFTSFGFHGSIPSIVKYMGGEQKYLRIIFIIGSAIPLVVYIIWQLSTLGSLDNAVFNQILSQDSGLIGLLNSINYILSTPYVTQIANTFANLALATSFLGVTLGLFDYIGDVLKLKQGYGGRIITGVITFLPPLIIALYFQDFMGALRYAAIFLSFLALILPVLLVWKTRRLHPQQQTTYQVRGGNLGLLIVLFCGIGVMILGVTG